MTGMLVSGSTVQVWFDWERVEKDISAAVPEQLDGDIIAFTPRIVEMCDTFEAFVKLFGADISMPHPTRFGTVFIKRGKNVAINS